MPLDTFNLREGNDLPWTYSGYGFTCPAMEPSQYHCPRAHRVLDSPTGSCMSCQTKAPTSQQRSYPAMGSTSPITDPVAQKPPA